MAILQIVVLAVIQGLAELLPVSSSAHVIVAEKLMGVDPSSPEMTFLLVMLHTGTMCAVILYFWPRWRERFPRAADGRAGIFKTLLIATVVTGIVGLVLKQVIEKVALHGAPRHEVEALFSNLPLMAASLAAVGALILWAGAKEEANREGAGENRAISGKHAAWIGAVQGLCLPFRGFSRSGATISAALLCGISQALAEDFSFALAVILTPPVIAKEAHRLVKAASAAGGSAVHAGLFAPGLLGMVFSFLAGLAALRWLSSWLETGRWRYFGCYCLAAAAGVLCAAKFIA